MMYKVVDKVDTRFYFRYLGLVTNGVNIISSDVKTWPILCWREVWMRIGNNWNDVWINSRVSAILRSSHQEVFWKKGVFKNFAKFTGKHPCQSLFFAAWGLQLLKRESGTGVFCDLVKFFRTPFFITPLVAASLY